ncbi:MAG: serine phosphatase RsbU [uncultured bacterium]|nr:MAG: serine phosphatase RsbU [uncultured bacterium]
MNNKELIDQAFYELINGKAPTAKLPESLQSELFAKVAQFNTELMQVIMQMSSGQLETGINYKGPLAGAVKTLQASLKHLTWQTNAIANGDLTQNIAFMGEFSDAFNRMVDNLRESRKTIEMKNEELERDLTLAEEIQQTMLGELARTDFIETHLIYRPLHKVSGDFVFTCCNSVQQFSAFLGDVSGHGIAAALITIMTKTALETILPDNAPDEVMRQLNTMLAESIPEGMYLTGALVKISADGRMTMTNAAHPVIIVQQHDSEHISKISGTGLSLGMFEEEIEQYSSSELRLQSGDRVFLFSDGLLDIKTDRGFFGIEGIADLLRSSRQQSLAATMQLLNLIVNEAAANNAVSDDLTVLALEFTGPKS